MKYLLNPQTTNSCSFYLFQPRFKLLGFLWKKLQQFVYFLSEINLFLDNLHSLDPVGDFLKGIKIPADDFDIISSPDLERSPTPRTKTAFEFSNYCTWSLSRGFLVSVGEKRSFNCQFNNRNYAFTSEASLKRFKMEPEKVLLDIVKVTYDRPEIMLLLGRAEEFSHLIGMQNEEFRRAFYGTKDSTCQTEKISIPRSKAIQDNILLLRKMGLRLANQQNYSSTCSQTEGVYKEKSSTGSQTATEKRTKSVQTSKEKEIQTE